MRSIVEWRVVRRRKGQHPGPVRHHADARLGIPVEANRHVFLASAQHSGIIDPDFSGGRWRQGEQIGVSRALEGATVQIDLAVAGREREAPNHPRSADA